LREIEDPKRRLLIEALTLGIFSGGMAAASAWAQVFGAAPAKLPPGQSIYRIRGTATVNAQPATLESRIVPGDTVQTGRDSELVFVVGSQGMLLRAESKLTIDGEKGAGASFIVSALRLITGKLLSVSRDSNMRLTTATATIGIRGTGWYAESDPEQTYFCTCYGSTEIAATNDPASAERIQSTHHDRPLYILAKAEPGRAIRSAPWRNHTDDELSLIETLVGRTPPFGSSYKTYQPPPPSRSRDY
jgi:hypothetical protein